ncbi:hypothetical protein QL285_033888 [Trifolium repens]|nr:hypothetical protein QL285_033888 [Trifolium repens]
MLTQLNLHRHHRLNSKFSNLLSITLPLQLHVPPLVLKRDDDGKIIIRPCSKEPTELHQEAERSTPQAARNILMWHLNFEIGYWFQEFVCASLEVLESFWWSSLLKFVRIQESRGMVGFLSLS